MTNCLKKTAVLSLGLLLTQPLSAQVPQELTLAEARRLALLFNPGYRRAQNDIVVADANIRSSYGRFLPRLGTDLRFGGSSSSILTATDDFGRPIGEARRIETASSSASQGAELSTRG